jgi:hypothetical protein
MAYNLRRTARSPRDRLSGVLGLVAVVGACGGSDADTETRRFENIGVISLSPGNGSMTISVAFNSCLSSCNQNVGSCSASVVGDTVVIETLLEVITDKDSDGICDTACWPAAASCQLENPPSGTYSIHSGMSSARIELPVSAPTQVIDNGGTYSPE